MIWQIMQNYKLKYNKWEFTIDPFNNLCVRVYVCAWVCVCVCACVCVCVCVWLVGDELRKLKYSHNLRCMQGLILAVF